MTELTRSRQKEIAGLARKRNRDAAGEYLAEGVRAVESAVRAGAPIREILVTAEVALSDRVAAILRGADVPIHHIASEQMARITDTRNDQGLLAVLEIQTTTPVSLTGAVIALDGVQDPGNVGAIIRSAAWFGVSGIVIGPETADPFGTKAVRASMGGLWDLEIALVDDLASYLDAVRQQGKTIAGADLDGVPLGTWGPPPEGILVLGSEAHGLRPEVRQRVDRLVQIAGAEQRTGVESLNVTVAAGILLHHWLG